MLYPFMTCPDGTEIVYSDLFRRAQDGAECVRVYFERVRKDGEAFDSMNCILPGGSMQEVVGFTEAEVQRHEAYLHKLTEVLLDCARDEVGKSA